MEDWLIKLVAILGAVIIVFTSGMPVAFAFLLVNLIGVYIFLGGPAGIIFLTHSLFQSVNSFVLLPLPLFIFLGEVMFRSGSATRMIDIVDKWLGKLPGRLSLVTVTAGTIMSALSGVSYATCAILGSVLVPEMEKRGYKNSMSVGPILGSGGISILIPPSGIAVVLASLAGISVAGILIGGIVPGLLTAVVYAVYIIIRCKLQPDLAPAYEVPRVSRSQLVIDTLRYVVPLGLIFFMIVGLILLGIATATESAAMGALGSIILAAIYKQVNWKMIKESIYETIRVTVMTLLIMASAQVFSQVLASSGATQGLSEFAVGIGAAPMVVVTAMMIVQLILGMFMSALPILMITIPIFIPVAHTLGINLLWLGILMLINMEVASISPPFGMSLFVMKAVTNPDSTTMGDIYKASVPFCLLDVLVMALIMAFPAIGLWLPSMIL